MITLTVIVGPCPEILGHIMWVKRTKEEIQKSRKQKKRRELVQFIFISALFVIFVSVLVPRPLIGVHGRVFADAEDIIETIATIIPFFIIGWFAFYWIKENPLNFCHKCERIYKDKRRKECVCGEALESIDHFRWIDN